MPGEFGRQTASAEAARPPRVLGVASVVAVCAAVLSGCSTVGDVSAPSAGLPQAFATSNLVGSWGIASYRRDEDRSRVEAMAREQCRLPYVIAKGPTDGVLMHVADDPKLYELRLKGSPDGRTYLGFEAPPGHWQDREIVEHTPDLLVMRFVSPDVATRYGTFVYVRCTA